MVQIKKQFIQYKIEQMFFLGISEANIQQKRLYGDILAT
jgi:hypothetical protein